VIDDPARVGDRPGQWVSHTGWVFERGFEVGGAVLACPRVDLVLEGVETIAEVAVNGVVVGACASAFVAHRFDVRALLRPGGNTLAVRFTSPIAHVRREAARLGAYPVNGDWEPYVFLRSCASALGWDWGPRVASCGLTGGVALEAWGGARVTSVVPRVRAAGAGSEGGARWRVGVRVEVERAAAGTAEPLRVRATLRTDAGTFAAEAALAAGACAAEVELPDVEGEAWWPRRAGPAGSRPALHAMHVEVLGAGGVVAARGQRLGLRTVELDLDGGGFALVVNGERTLCLGANWIPEGLWPRDRGPERVGARLDQAAAAGMNMLRVWGGGRYEPSWFYERCDELGLLVWQDFMFACACYPEEPPYPALVEREAREQVARLAAHPSVALWCGGNECVWAYESWGFKAKMAERGLPGRGWGGGYYHTLLPRVVGEVAPGSVYWPNSPWSGQDAATPNGGVGGDRHTWDADLVADRPTPPAFCSEFGQQSPSNGATLSAAMGEAALRLGAPWLTERQLGPGGNDRWYAEPLARHFPGPPAPDFASWHAQAQALQARALSAHLRWLRAHWPRCAGALLWQLNDAWPGLSWSIIDSAGVPKPAYSAVVAALAPRLLTIEPDGDGLAVFACNDAPCVWSGEVEVMAAGRRVARAAFAVPARSVSKVVRVEGPERGGVVASAVGGNERAAWPA
jgi:beta-mannosidase